MALLEKVEEMLLNAKDLADTNVPDQLRLLRNITGLIDSFLGNNSQFQNLDGDWGNEKYDFYNARIELGKTGKRILQERAIWR